MFARLTHCKCPLRLLNALVATLAFGCCDAIKADPLIQPMICSAIGAGAAERDFPFCRVTATPGSAGHHDLTLSLTATTAPIQVGGYLVSTPDNYNGGYLPPVLELDPGDTLKVRLLNALSSTPPMASMQHAGMVSETNLHTHGLIVSPKNAHASLPQNGDNIFVNLGRGQDLDYKIEIPAELPASILDGYGKIAHPNGLYWYHSHLHGISAWQVGGGMSGLLSIGPRDNNLIDADPAKTPALRASTDVSYLMLRDMQITSSTDPVNADGRSGASWQSSPNTSLCEPVAGGVVAPPIQQREGYCQSPTDKTKIWLFTVNGQRYPTLRIPNGRNALLRIANLSASATYQIDFRDSSNARVEFNVVSVDGVVPGTPSPAGSAARPVEAIKLPQLLLMPASRVEIFFANDDGNKTERQLVFHSNRLNTAAQGEAGGDPWPEVRLASIILEGAPTAVASATQLALNVPASTPAAAGAALSLQKATAPQPHAGCVRDMDRTNLEHRRIWFSGSNSDGWAVTTDLVVPKDKTKLSDPNDPNAFVADQGASLQFKKFDDYLKNGAVDWDATSGRPQHTCVNLRTGHGQLWELVNISAELHNFHIHQTKFRPPTDNELKAYGIDPAKVQIPQTVKDKLSYFSAKDNFVWHDTLPLWPNVPVFIVINFDAQEQLGRYVYHCHILTHEDNGLMAPIEVLP